MSDTAMPKTRPSRPFFSSGPCVKRPEWSIESLKNSLVSRSHRAKVSLERIKYLIDKSKQILGIPSDYLVGIVPGSDTGAFELALWNFIGSRGVDVFAWEAFSSGWVSDLKNELKVQDLRVFDEKTYGKIPDLSKADFSRDVVFTWNGTTSGVRVPNSDWIKNDREGLVFCDATSAVFCMDIDWQKIDILTYSFQKAMGGEAAHGVLVLSPKAVKRIESNPPVRSIPRLFKILKNGKVDVSIFEGSTINTPSMLCIEDAIDSIEWIESIGGVKECIKQSNEKLSLVKHWIKSGAKFAFLNDDESTISNTSVCLKIHSPLYNLLPEDKKSEFAKEIIKILEKEGAAYDAGAYRDAPPGVRIWCGATVVKKDVENLLPWLDYAYEVVSKKFS